MALIPLFPLSVVLFPGVPLPLHIFEERYRLLVRELLAQPEPREFGIIAARRDGTLHTVGCTAELRHAEPYEDGRWDILTVGSRRFRLDAVEDALPYFQGRVEYLSDAEGAGADELAGLVATAVIAYRAALTAVAETDPGDSAVPDLPDEPGLLSCVVAATLPLDLPARQELLECPDAASRLRRELTWLRQETALATHFAAEPPEVHTAGPFSLN